MYHIVKTVQIFGYLLLAVHMREVGHAQTYRNVRWAIV